MPERMPDDDRPNVARIYDYLLGGAHNFAVDRAAAAVLFEHWPRVAAAARANRNFLRVAVEHALDHGIRQFLDLGSGIPTVGNVHEVAHRRFPEVRVAYVDNEAVAVAHSATMLAAEDLVTITDADLRLPATVLTAPGVAGLLDFDRPVALLAVTALHFVPDDQEARDILATYRAALAPGSLLALTHASDGYDEATAQEMVRTPTPLTVRAPERIASLLGDFRVDGDGMRDIAVFAREDEPVGGVLGLQSLITEPLAG